MTVNLDLENTVMMMRKCLINTVESGFDYGFMSYLQKQNYLQLSHFPVILAMLCCTRQFYPNGLLCFRFFVTNVIYLYCHFLGISTAFFK